MLAADVVDLTEPDEEPTPAAPAEAVEAEDGGSDELVAEAVAATAEPAASPSGNGAAVRKADPGEPSRVELLEIEGTAAPPPPRPARGLVPDRRSCCGARPAPEPLTGIRRRTDARGSSIEPVFDPTGPVLGIDPGVSRCGYGAVAGRAAGSAAPDCRAVAFGVIRTPPDLPLPERLGRLQTELEALVEEVAPVRAGRRAGAVPGQRPHRDVGRARRAGSRWPPRPGRDPGRAVQPERGEARGRGLRRRGEGRGAGDGGPAAASARPARIARRRRRARARALPPLGREAPRGPRTKPASTRRPGTRAPSPPRWRKDAGTR